MARNLPDRANGDVAGVSTEMTLGNGRHCEEKTCGDVMDAVIDAVMDGEG